MGFDLMEVGQTVLEGLHEASETIIDNLCPPLKYINGAVGVLVGVIINCLSGKNKQSVEMIN